MMHICLKGEFTTESKMYPVKQMGNVLMQQIVLNLLASETSLHGMKYTNFIISRHEPLLYEVCIVVLPKS